MPNTKSVPLVGLSNAGYPRLRFGVASAVETATIGGMLRHLITLGLLSCAAVLLRAEPAAESVDLLAGPEFVGWTVVTAAGADIKTVCTLKPDGVVAVTGTPTGYLETTASYENYALHLEYRWPTDAAPRSNGGVLLHIAAAPVAPSPWPHCFQLQMKMQSTGDLLQMAGATFAEPVTPSTKASSPPFRARQEAPSEKPLGEWNVLDVVCRSGAIEVRVNGVVQNRVTQAVPRAGRIGLQLEGAAYELRNVRLTPLTAE